MAEQSQVVAGVAGGKATLVAALRAGVSREFANTPAGRERLLAWLEQRQGALVVCEPSGGYEKGLVGGLHQAQRAVSLVAPGRARAYAKAMGQAAKTDPLDARRLARYGEKREPEPEREQVKELLARRQQLVDERVREHNRLEQEKSFEVEDSLFRHLEWLDREIEQRDRQYKELLASSQSLAPAAKLYCSVRGVGIQTAATLLAWLPELGRGDGKGLTALAGLAPWPKDSGKQQGYRAIKGGRSVVRRALYLAAMTALRRKDNDLSRFYCHLRERGKPGKVAMVAAMRKLLLPWHAIARRGTPGCRRSARIRPPISRKPLDGQHGYSRVSGNPERY